MLIQLLYHQLVVLIQSKCLNQLLVIHPHPWACYHHNVVSSHESSAKHTYPIVKSPEVPTVPASESSRAIDVFKTGSIFCNDDSLLVAGTLDNIPV